MNKKIEHFSCKGGYRHDTTMCIQECKKEQIMAIAM